MYSACPIAEAIYQPGTPFLSTAPHFDGDYEFRRKSNLMRNADPLFDTEVIGGPRLRMFYPDFARSHALETGRLARHAKIAPASARQSL